ncbi:biopolymer transporter ExbD [Pelagicoccus sp. SDUM812005]|uniref:ExbD/TolR family protein n=1 Tax=Pelagicoccus sp. SDUM812005 TaxID=3041257 RepID=UPI00280DBF50|nr:biopolymer transporter ExbD [Pelagicoccus sp. SDUM812005]MDQ8182518.1 biopolymer transporter ExbD [Pelagicoccus sp. SDUM812005]
MREKSLKGEDEAADINISPLIDMVFILLIFFIVTTVFVDESGLGIERPIPSPEIPDPETEPFVLRVSRGGAVYLGEKEIGMDGVRYAVANARNAGALEPVTIEAHPETKVGFVAEILGICSQMEVKKVVTKTTDEKSATP